MAYLTFFDVVEHLITASFGGPQDAEQRDIRTAVHRAYSEVTQIRDWAYYHVHGRVITSQPYSTGTISSSGSTVTLSGGTWPAWAGTGAFLRAGEEIVPVTSRTSGSVVVVGLGFKANLTSQPYTLYRTVYPLPDDFRNLDEPSDEYNWWSGQYVTPDEAMKMERVSNSTGAPYHWTVIKDPNSSGWAIKLIGYPTDVETVDFTYRRSARPLRYSGHESSARAGTIARVDTTVTGTATEFSSAMTGSVLRVGPGPIHPGPLASITPYVSETLITSAPGSAGCITEASGVIAAGTKFVVTDPVDVPPHMHNVIYSGAEYWLARIRGSKPDNAFAMYQRDLRLAMEMDQLAPLSGRSQQIWHDGGWKSPLKSDEGT